MRKKTKAVVSAKPDGRIIRRFVKPSNHNRTLIILRELNIDVKEYMNDCRLRSLFRQSDLGLI